ncbi:hypothetical protein [Hyalangium rubrum]|uniref:Lipoprotein n=1 Tax=Hyalangium rubrum TaxID=3103134 RepID=A0ABU5HFZ8_9BACT|nr:hypothetical protein [Hyalangium sp. s54d21]MDY7232400.1 hypothetical protein [Hyalangium sp. s54d21]
MKKLLVLVVFGLSVGCGVAVAPEEEMELGTVTGAQCGACPTGTVTSGYYCDSSCDPNNNCALSWSGRTCTATSPITGTIYPCYVGTCPLGYYGASQGYAAGCVSPPWNTSTAANQTTCVPVPAPSPGLTYTECGSSANCATGFRVQSRTSTSACASTSTPNATICEAI